MKILVFLLFFLGEAYIGSGETTGIENVPGNGISCLDNKGNKINWSITYKLPRVRNSNHPKYREGSGYAFITPTGTEWIEPEEGIDNATSTIGQTLTPLFENVSDTAYFVYNDQPPSGPTVQNNGHTKGVILTNANGGIWLIHSVPHFPSMTVHSYSYPTTGYSNGQMFLCLTLNVTQVDGIAEVLTYTRPNIFNYTIPKSMSKLLPNLSNFVKKKHLKLKTPPWYKVIQLQVDRLEFLIFAKGPKFHREIYADWIAPNLESSLDVQSWLNGPNPFASNCSSNYTVHNILFKVLDSQDFSSHSDHSKWATGTTNPYACIGDLNRMEHQMMRGGALLCAKDTTIWNLLRTLITEIQPCPRKRSWF